MDDKFNENPWEKIIADLRVSVDELSKTVEEFKKWNNDEEACNRLKKLIEKDPKNGQQQ